MPTPPTVKPMQCLVNYKGTWIQGECVYNGLEHVFMARIPVADIPESIKATMATKTHGTILDNPTLMFVISPDKFDETIKFINSNTEHV